MQRNFFTIIKLEKCLFSGGLNPQRGSISASGSEPGGPSPRGWSKSAVPDNNLLEVQEP